MTVLVCGSRGWNDIDTIQRELSALPKGTLLVQGFARGADMQAVYVARHVLRAHNFEVRGKRADWARFGRRAGIERTRQLFDEYKPELVLAFWDGRSRGTAFTFDEAQRRGIETRVIRERETVPRHALSS